METWANKTWAGLPWDGTAKKREGLHSSLPGQDQEVSCSRQVTHEGADMYV